MPREEVEYRWESLKNPYVPGYTLRRYVNRKRKTHLVEGWKGELNILQDINKERWLIGLDMVDNRLKGDPKPEKRRATTHAATADDARREAERLLNEVMYPKPVDADAFG